MLIERKEAYVVFSIVGLLCYCAMMYLLEQRTGGRIHWLGAAILNLGGPHLLSGFVGVVGGFFAALWYETKLDQKGNKK